MTTWTLAIQQVETWSGSPKVHVFSPLVFSAYPVFDTKPFVSHWAGRVQQVETWIDIEFPLRVFSPLVFSLHPVFDTGSVAGIWLDRAIQSEQWTKH